MWRPTEPYTRIPLTADFTAAKGRAIIFGILAVVLLALGAVGENYIESNFVEVSGFINLDGTVSYTVGSQTYTIPLRESRLFSMFQDSSPIMATPVFEPLLVNINNPQIVIFFLRWIALPPSDMVLFVGAMFAAASLLNLVLHKVGHKGVYDKSARNTIFYS